MFDCHWSRRFATLPNWANGALANFFSDSTPALVRDSIVSGNTVEATSGSGSATILGVGVLNAGSLELRNDQINGNRGTVDAASGDAQGAGVWNGVWPGGSPSQLTLRNTRVSQNVLSGGAGITLG